ncbi:MAG: helix-turn-helix domain-containing protein [Ruminococcus sp.]|jgi:carbohydrate diacid regulator|nr:helix-turn-helix domain-containing protein [Ruminococcus sp.]
MANQVFTKYIQDLSDVVEAEIGIVDESARILACSDNKLVGNVRDYIPFDFGTSHKLFVRDGYTYKPFGKTDKTEFAVFVEGVNETAASQAEVLAASLSNMSEFYDEKYDKTSFIKSAVLDNILPGEVVIKARELRFNNEVDRVVFIIRSIGENSVFAYEVVTSLFPDRNKDFAFYLNDTDLVLVKEIRSSDADAVGTEELEQLAHSIADTFTGEFFSKVLIGIGSIVHYIKDVAKSFKEAKSALDVGRIFDSDINIISYNKLGIARLIYHLPPALCDNFLSEVFKDDALESIDAETMNTIQKFFENNLNVSETSRHLFVHRNTLVYRLDRIKKETGLDLREFDEAIIFKIALMVRKFLASK